MNAFMSGKFIAPMNDVLFKKVFADPKNQLILKHFIQDITGLNVQKLTIENPYNSETFYRNRQEGTLLQTEVDVLARLEDQSQVTIEMQQQKQKFFWERVIFYVTQRYGAAYGGKLAASLQKVRSGTKYRSLRPVYGIDLLNFRFFEDDYPFRTFHIYDVEHQQYGIKKDTLNWSFLELTKDFSKDHPQLIPWVDFFLKGKVSELAPEYIKQACQIVQYQNLDWRERKMIDAAELAREDYKATILYYEEEAMERGMKKGIEKGIEQGKEQSKLLTAKRMLAEGLSAELVQKVLGVDPEFLKQL